MQSNTETELQPGNRALDKEVTLGPLLLTVLGLGLLAVCCICFLVGYTVGRHSGSANPSGIITSAFSGRSAAEILAQSQAAHPAASGSPAPVKRAEPEATTAAFSPTASAQTPEAPVQPESSDEAQPVQQRPAVQSTVRPALSQSAAQPGSWVVQVAAVEDSQDADVLVTALRRRGYSVSAHRNPGDNLLHVQVGPFASRSDADAMRQKLLNDGYNAIVEQ